MHSRFFVVPEYPIASPLPAHDVKSCAKFPLNAPPGVSHEGASGKEIISVAKSEKVEIAPIATPVIVAREICIMFFIAIKLLFTFIVPYSFLCCNNIYWQASNSFFYKNRKTCFRFFYSVCIFIRVPSPCDITFTFLPSDVMFSCCALCDILFSNDLLRFPSEVLLILSFTNLLLSWSKLEESVAIPVFDISRFDSPVIWATLSGKVVSVGLELKFISIIQFMRPIDDGSSFIWFDSRLMVVIHVIPTKLAGSVSSWFPAISRDESLLRLPILSGSFSSRFPKRLRYSKFIKFSNVCGSSVSSALFISMNFRFLSFPMPAGSSLIIVSLALNFWSAVIPLSVSGSFSRAQFPSRLSSVIPSL